LSPLLTGYLDDLFSFDPINMIWTLFSVGVQVENYPSARMDHGFASAGGKLYVFGGYNGSSSNETSLANDSGS
jgi:hypothetical protein